MRWHLIFPQVFNINHLKIFLFIYSRENFSQLKIALKFILIFFQVFNHWIYLKSIMCLESIKLLLHLVIYSFCLCVYMCVICTSWCMWWSQSNLQEIIVSSYHVGFGDQTQVLRVGSSHPYPLRHRASPRIHLNLYYFRHKLKRIKEWT